VALLGRACLNSASAAGGARATSALKPPAASLTGLAAGACQSFAPTGKSRGRTVFIDPGHGGLDPGVLGRTASGAQLKESTVALGVARELGRQLRADGYGVVISRTADTSVLGFELSQMNGGTLTATQVRQDLQARVRCANTSKAAALVSIHFNGYQDPTAGGTQTIYDAARPFAAQNVRLAQSLQSAMVSRLSLTDRGLMTDDELQAPTLSDRAGSYGHLLLLGPPEPGWLEEGTTMPGALVEPLFLTAPAEAAIASSPDGQRRLAAALAAGIEDYLADTPAH
jgi:N-acetylmuramoyl-L-alanine amidase